MKIEDMFSSFKNSSGEMVGYIDIFGEIGEGWGQNGARDFINKFRDLERECSQIVINMSSSGGSVFTGQQIASEIKSSKTYVVCKLQALCASIATVIACACDKIIMPNNCLWMTHAPLMSLQGNAYDMRSYADLLDKIEETILNIYSEKCGNKCSKDELKQLISGKNKDGQGTWMSAQECFDCGFIDEIGHELAIAAKLDDPKNAIINNIKMDLSGYQDLDKVREMFENKNGCKNNTSIKNDIEETNMSEKTKISASLIDQIAQSFKTVFGVKDEVEPEVEQPQEEVVEVAETPVAPQEESQDVEVQDEETQEEPVAEEGVQEEQEPEVAEEPQQEEPEQEQEELEAETEIEPSVEVEDSIVPEVQAGVDLVAQVKALTEQLEMVKNADAQKAVMLAKAELAKEVENKFKGVPGKLEDKVEKIYSIKNSNLKEDEKEFILNSLSSLSELNTEACEEVGADGQNEPTGENDIMAQAKKMSEEHDISEAKAVAVIKGGLKLSDAKKNK